MELTSSKPDEMLKGDGPLKAEPEGLEPLYLTPGNKNQRVYILRHGATALSDRSDGYLDLPLSDKGREDLVDTLQDHLKFSGVRCIYCAPLQRTEETAHILASGIVGNPEIEVTKKALTWDLGSLSGDYKKPNKAIVSHLLDNPSKSAPDGKSYDSFTGVFDPWFWSMLKSSKKDGPLLLVLSGSNCRRISELITGDRQTLNLDEGGCALLAPDKDGDWSAEVLCGAKEDDDEDS
jgi:broad specificity phosphatase PhoE